MTGRGAGADAYEAAVLESFWRQAEASDDRLALLKEAAAVVIERPDTWRPETVRAESAAVQIDKFACFCCRHRDRAIDVHHVVQVHHGGSSSHRNLVPLCRRCHGLIHPHLAEPIEQGWTSFADGIGRALEAHMSRVKETA